MFILCTNILSTFLNKLWNAKLVCILHILLCLDHNTVNISFSFKHCYPVSFFSNIELLQSLFALQLLWSPTLHSRILNANNMVVWLYKCSHEKRIRIHLKRTFTLTRYFCNKDGGGGGNCSYFRKWQEYTYVSCPWQKFITIYWILITASKARDNSCTNYSRKKHYQKDTTEYFEEKIYMVS